MSIIWTENGECGVYKGTTDKTEDEFAKELENAFIELMKFSLNKGNK